MDVVESKEVLKYFFAIQYNVVWVGTALSLVNVLPDLPYILRALNPCLWSVTTGAHIEVTVFYHFQVPQLTHTRKYKLISRTNKK